MASHESMSVGRALILPVLLLVALAVWTVTFLAEGPSKKR
jgi:hypothetical protein